jgi:hypothetical protein
LPFRKEIERHFPRIKDHLQSNAQLSPSDAHWLLSLTSALVNRALGSPLLDHLDPLMDRSDEED